jgi:hypothetical protein
MDINNNFVYLQDVVKDLDECSYYVIEVSLYKGNCTFSALLYTGFKSGAYRAILCGDKAYDPHQYHNALYMIHSKIEIPKENNNFVSSIERRYNKYGRLRS